MRKAGNAETILTSELYKSTDSAKNGITSVQSNHDSDAHYEKTESSNGKNFVNLKAANRQVIGTSQMYASAASRDGGINPAKTNGGSSAIKDNS